MPDKRILNFLVIIALSNVFVINAYADVMYVDFMLLNLILRNQQLIKKVLQD